MNFTILATAWHVGGANAILPVMQHLQLVGKSFEVITIAHGYSQKVFEHNRWSHHTIDAYGQDSVSVHSAAKILEKVDPSLVLTGTSNQDEEVSIEQAFTQAARIQGRKSLAVLDFWGDYTRRFSDSIQKFRYVPDKIAIMDEMAKEAMLKERFDENRLVITGNPHFDGIASMKRRGYDKKSKILSSTDLDPSSYVILFASQPLEKRQEQLGYNQMDSLSELVEGIKPLHSKKNISLIIRKHSRETDAVQLEQIVKGSGIPYFIDGGAVDHNRSMWDLIMSSDLVVSPWSTTLIESTYFDKPSISLQPGLKSQDPLFSNEKKITVGVYNKGEVGKVIEKIMFDEHYGAELAENRKQMTLDGNATENVVNLVYNMLGLLK